MTQNARYVRNAKHAVTVTDVPVLDPKEDSLSFSPQSSLWSAVHSQLKSGLWLRINAGCGLLLGSCV